MSRALGRYELLRPLARGGMAEVYLARRRAAGVEKVLVVKRIRAERATDVTFLDLFVREARLSMSLAHQNIVPVFDFGRIDDQVFLAMERVEGRDLSSSLARAGAPLSPLLAAFVAAECCQALDYAHRRKSPEGAPLGIVHRDVTPRNVLLSWSGEVKLTDFGIAALAGDSTTALLGTPAYMAPEQARREALDARTDVYAVGLILREMLTGERAREGTDRDTMIGNARTGELRPWPVHSIPAALVAIVDRATSLSPADRHADARALLADLDEVIVADRSAKKADAPARQLAAWLDATWGAVRDDDAGTSGEIVADHMVSFLDDGALDVMGTGTQRSLLATAGESVLIDANASTIVPSVLVPAEKTEPGEKSVTEPSPPPRSTLRFVAPLLLLAIGVLAVVLLLRRDSSSTPVDAAVVATSTDAAVIDASIDVAVLDAAVIDAPTVEDPVDARPDDVVVRDAAIREPRDAAIREPRDAAIRDAATPEPQAALRTVMINATPWAYFTVDTNPMRYETPRRISLTPGKHVIHFENPELQITKDVTLDVPADRDINHVERLAP